MTPSLRGRTATILAGVRPTIRLASAPTARGRFVLASIATTDGSLMTMPLPRTSTSVLAVPRSMPTSRESRPKSAFSMRPPSRRETELALAQAHPAGAGAAGPADDHVVENLDVEEIARLD